MTYLGGRVLTGTPTVAVVWAGAWLDGRQSALLNTVFDASGSDYFAVLRGYHDAAGRRPSGALTVVGSMALPGATLSSREELDATVAGAPPADLVIIAASASVRPFGLQPSRVSAYHFESIGRVALLVADLAGQVETPDETMRDMQLSLLHELAEAITDPDVATGWRAGDQEMADVCDSEPLAYVSLGVRKYLLQPLWSVDAGACVFHP